ncbi:MAG TPA: helix-turn-helix transcriptional regulator [Xanthobacteraceae bacterium]|nr:helix-turn-helix transcriptional regulator [Xanthobacteraceae bacterium]
MARRDTFGREHRALIATLVARRKAAGLTQWDVARKLKTEQSRISKIERRQSRLDVIDYVRICRAIGIDPGEPLRSIKIG